MLTIGDNKHYLLEGWQTFLLASDTGWLIFVNLTDGDRGVPLSEKQSRGDQCNSGGSDILNRGMETVNLHALGVLLHL